MNVFFLAHHFRIKGANKSGAFTALETLALVTNLESDVETKHEDRVIMVEVP